MRQFNKLFITPLLFTLTACMPIATNNSILTSGLSQMSLVAMGGGEGGNPEVYLNQCFGLKDDARQRCFDIFYPDNNINISTYPKSGETIKLAGRKSSIERRRFNLKGKDRFVFYLNILNVKLPIKCNAKSAKLTQYKHSLVVDVPVKDIENNLTLEDKEGKIILDYMIVK